MTEFQIGFMVGLLVGEGHFGGDGVQAHVALKMHVRHERIFKFLVRVFPGGSLYGPYSHGGRNYYLWSVRGKALWNELVPILDKHLTPDIDEHVYRRYEEMKRKYKEPRKRTVEREKRREDRLKQLASWART